VRRDAVIRQVFLIGVIPNQEPDLHLSTS
jgi:hypothetical protein